MVCTDVFGRGIDVERVNIVINYDFPQVNERGESFVDTYLHRIGRAGRFGTKGMAISFVSGEADEKAFAEVQEVFADVIPELPDSIDQSEYSACPPRCPITHTHTLTHAHARDLLLSGHPVTVSFARVCRSANGSVSGAAVVAACVRVCVCASVLPDTEQFDVCFLPCHTHTHTQKKHATAQRARPSAAARMTCRRGT